MRDSRYGCRADWASASAAWSTSRNCWLKARTARTRYARAETIARRSTTHRNACIGRPRLWHGPPRRARSFAPGSARAGEWPTNSLRLPHHDRDDLRDLVAALVLGRDAHEPARLEVGQRELLLDESCLPGLGRPRELDDLGLGFEDDGHAILLCTASGAQRNPASVVRPPRDSDST